MADFNSYEQPPAMAPVPPQELDTPENSAANRSLETDTPGNQENIDAAANSPSIQEICDKYHFDLESMSEPERQALEQAAKIDLDTAEFALVDGQIIAYDQQGHRTSIDYQRAIKIFGRSAKFRQEMQIVATIERTTPAQTTTLAPETLTTSLDAPPTTQETVHLEAQDLPGTQNITEVDHFIDLSTTPLTELAQYDPTSIENSIQDQLQSPDYDLALDLSQIGAQLDAATSPAERDRLLAALPDTMRADLTSPTFQNLFQAENYQDVLRTLAPESPQLQSVLERGLPNVDALVNSQSSEDFLRQIATENPDLTPILDTSLPQMDALTKAQNLKDLQKVLGIPDSEFNKFSQEMGDINQLLQARSLEEALASPALPDFLRPILKELSSAVELVSKNFDAINKATNNVLAPILDVRNIVSNMLSGYMMRWNLQQFAYMLRAGSRDGTSFLANNRRPSAAK